MCDYHGVRYKYNMLTAKEIHSKVMTMSGAAGGGSQLTSCHR